MALALFWIFLFICKIPFFRGGSLLRADKILSLGFIIYGASVPLNYFWLDNSNNYNEEDIFNGLLLLTLFVSAFQLAFHIVLPQNRLSWKLPIIQNSTYYRHPYIFVSFILLLASILLIYWNVQINFGGFNNYFSMLRSDVYKIRQSAGMGLYEIAYSIFHISFILMLSKVLYENLRIKKYRLYGVVLIFMFLFYSLFLFNSGDRRLVVNLILGSAVLLIQYNKIKVKVLCIVGIPLAIGLQLFSYLRAALNRPGGMTRLLNESFSLEWLDVSKGETGGQFEILVNLYNDINVVGYKYGATYWDSITMLVPSFLAERNTEGLAKWYVQIYDPIVYHNGSTKAFSFVAETFMNFGYLGPIIIGLILGALSRFWWLFTMVRNTSPFNNGLYAAYLHIYLVLPRLYSNNLFKEFWIFTIAIAMIIWFSSLFFKGIVHET